MSKPIRIIGIKRREIDEEKLALAFLLLAKTLHDRRKDVERSRPHENSEKAEAA